MGAAARFERQIIVSDGKTPHQAGFCLSALERAAGNKKGGKIPALFSIPYQFRKQRRPNGPECQPGGQLYIGRHPP
jgi:hypothetical protein